jgi:hypothetical protein
LPFAALIALLAWTGVAAASTPTGVRGLNLEQVERFAALTAPTVFLHVGQDFSDSAMCVEGPSRRFLCDVQHRTREFGVIYDCRPHALTLDRLMYTRGYLSPGLRPGCYGRLMTAKEKAANIG